MRVVRTDQRPRAPKRRGNSAVIRWLVFCFPLGLMMMWSDRCNWGRYIKSAVSLGIVCLLLVLVLPQTRAPKAVEGGVRIVSMEAGAQELYGPTLRPDSVTYEAYVPKYVPRKNTIAEPIPTPIPYDVYANNGGKYYHEKKCRYVKATTPKSTLIQASDAGFKACKECKAPTLEQFYGTTID